MNGRSTKKNLLGTKQPTNAVTIATLDSLAPALTHFSDMKHSMLSIMVFGDVENCFFPKIKERAKKK